MWDRIKTVRLDELGREIVEFHDTDKFDQLAAILPARHPNSYIEIKFV